MLKYGKHILIAVDQLANAVVSGWPDETFSSRCWRWHNDKVRSYPKIIVDTLLFWDKDHCKNSYESERLGRQLPPELR